MTTAEQRDLIEEFRETFPFLITVEDTMRFTLGLHEEYKRWRKLADDMAGCLDSSMDASDALHEYEQAVRDEK